MSVTIRAFLRRDRIDQRLLIHAAALHLFVAGAIHVLPFGRLRRLLRPVAGGMRPTSPGDIDVRVVRAVRTVSARLPGTNCLTEALVAHALLARHRCETTLCFGVARQPADEGALDAHAWLERRDLTVIGARAVHYDRLRHPSRCAPSPSPR